jgi:nicotinate dehydrogenase subunit B
VANPIEVERYELHALTPRRDMLRLLGGGILIGILFPLDAQRRSGNEPTTLGAWLHIAHDGVVTVYSGKAEVGQNVRTSLAQAVAEELDLPATAIQLVLGDTRLTPYDMGTFGSRSTPFMAPQLRRAAVAARELLLDLAAERLAVPRASLKLSAGRINGLTYGELTRGQQLTRDIAADLAIHPPRGESIGKLNARAIVTGREKYTSDLKFPGMLYGRVIRPSAFKAELASIDTAAARKLPGVTVVHEGNFVGITADESGKLDSAASAVTTTWNAPKQISSAELYTHLRSPITWRPIDAPHQLTATYTLPYIAHVPLEPRAAVAIWNDNQLTVHTGTQVPFGVHSELARAFNIPESQVRVIVPPTGSGYGGKHTGECAIEAARLARATGRPVKLQWTREEEMTWAYFRPAGVIDVRCGANAAGVITSWQFHNFNSGGAALRSPYNLPHQISEFHQSDSPLRQGSYRGLAATANHFARESAMDELAHIAHIEPATFRHKNTADPRLRAVIEAATERFRWGRAKDRAGQGFGMMAGFDKGGYVSACLEVTITGNTIRIDRIVQAFECGAIVNPDHLRHQVVGAAIQSLGGALFESIDFANGRILNPRLSRYRLPRFNDIPPIDVVLVDRKDLPSAGAGEAPIVAVAPALANAIFDATGKRLRSLPLQLHDTL